MAVCISCNRAPQTIGVGLCIPINQSVLLVPCLPDKQLCAECTAIEYRKECPHLSESIFSINAGELALCTTVLAIITRTNPSFGRILSEAVTHIKHVRAQHFLEAVA